MPEKDTTHESLPYIPHRAAVNSRLPKILYAGYMSSPFITQDKEFLENVYTLESFNFSQLASRFYQMPIYAVQCFTRVLPAVLRNDICWIWFADLPAVPFVFFSKLFGKKTVINIGGSEIYPPNEIGYGFQMKKFRGAVTRWLVRNTDMNVVMSDAYWDILTKLDPTAHAWVMPGCVDVSLYKPDFDSQEERAVTALCDWNMSRTLKGIPTFIAAQSKSQYPMEIIFQRSHRTMVNEFLKAKVYCQLSYTENFGMALLEAMACGCVPVVSDRHGLPELIGKSGIVVPYGDADATVKAVADAMKMDGRHARQRAEYYSVWKKQREMRNIINIVMNRGKSFGELLELME